MRLLDHEPPAPDYMDNLRRLYGDGVDELTARIADDEPNLSPDEVVMHALSFVPDVTAYRMPATQEDLLASALASQAEYMEYRRTQGL